MKCLSVKNDASLNVKLHFYYRISAVSSNIKPEFSYYLYNFILILWDKLMDVAMNNSFISATDQWFPSILREYFSKSDLLLCQGPPHCLGGWTALISLGFNYLLEFKFDEKFGKKNLLKLSHLKKSQPRRLSNWLQNNLILCKPFYMIIFGSHLYDNITCDHIKRQWL